MAIYPVTDPVASEVVVVKIGNNSCKVDKLLAENAKVIGQYLVGWVHALDTIELVVSDNVLNILSCPIPKSILRKLLSRLDEEIVTYLWYAMSVGLHGRFIKCLLNDGNAREYMQQRLGAIVMLKMLDKRPVDTNLEKIKNVQIDCLVDVPKGYIAIYKGAVLFKSDAGTILNDGLQIVRSECEVLTDEFAERLYSIFDPLIDEAALKWWAGLYRNCYEMIRLDVWEVQ
jgi:hypothetical protein